MNRLIWQWLFDNGGFWTKAEIAIQMGLRQKEVSDAIDKMVRGRTVAKQRTVGTHLASYGVDGTCLVPKGLRLGEVQL
jgi:hypothetical protein